jgi:hypothetical protein
VKSFFLNDAMNFFRMLATLHRDHAVPFLSNSLITFIPLRTWSDQHVRRIEDFPRLLTVFGAVSGIVVYLAHPRLNSIFKITERINARQERFFIRVASAAKGESVYTKTFGDTLEDQRFLRQVERLIFDAGINIRKSIVEPRIVRSKQYRVVIGVPKLCCPPHVATILSHAFKSIGIEAPIVAKRDNDSETYTTVQVQRT